MARRLKSWLRSGIKLWLLILTYVWVGTAYKLVYAQTHDVSRYKGISILPYYQQQFLVDQLLHQTWVLGPDFKDFLGELPSLAALVGSNVPGVLADYCRKRQADLTALPQRHPGSLYAEEALDAAYFFSRGSAILGLYAAREEPKTLVAARTRFGDWRMMGITEMAGSAELARRLADGYPESPEAPAALMNVATTQKQEVDPVPALETYRRILRDYPTTEQAVQAADNLYRDAQSRGKLREALLYKKQALQAEQVSARTRFAGRALPARNAVTVLGFRIDLSGLDLQLQQVQEAKELLAAADEEADRVSALPGLDGDLREEVRDARREMDRVENELWVADLFQDLKVGLPGPPPRPRQHPVSGTVLVDGKPLAGVVLIAAEARSRVRNFMPNPYSGARYRAMSDAKGRFCLPPVESGTYQLRAAFPARLDGSPVIPIDAPEGERFPSLLEVGEKDVVLPPLRLARAVSTRSFGELGATGTGLKLEWDPWPGAQAYRLEVLAAADQWGQFQRRVPREARMEFRRRPVLWTGDKLKETAATCPLLSLAPDNPAMLAATQYEYVVTALGKDGRELARSSGPLGRFHLSVAARNALLALKPPVRRDRPPPATRVPGRRGPGARPGGPPTGTLRTAPSPAAGGTR